MTRTYGYLSIVAASVLWGTMGILARLSFAYGISPEALIALRLVVSFATLLLLLLMFSRSALKIRKSDVHLFIVFGIFAVAAQRICYFNAVNLTTATMAAILFYTYPVFVTLSASLLFKEKITLQEALAIVLTFTGAALVVKIYDQSALSNNILGLMFGLGSSLLFVLYFMLGKKLRSNYASWTLVFYGDAVGALALTPIFFSAAPRILVFPWQLWLLILTIAWVPSLLAYLLYSYALKHVKSSRGSILSIIEPLSAAVFSSIFLRESLESLQIAGILFALTGVILLFHRDKVTD